MGTFANREGDKQMKMIRIKIALLLLRAAKLFHAKAGALLDIEEKLKSEPDHFRPWLRWEASK
jgi:hypothetical protein